MRRGEYIGPYGFFGYRKDPEDVHKLVVDAEAAVIVRSIFRMVGEGMRRNPVYSNYWEPPLYIVVIQIYCLRYNTSFKMCL